MTDDEMETLIHDATENVMFCAGVTDHEGMEQAAEDAKASVRQLCAALRDARPDSARLAELEAALQPFATFAQQWARQPMRGIGDAVYAIHSGTEYQAELRLSDMQRAAEVLSVAAPLRETTE